MTPLDGIDTSEDHAFPALAGQSFLISRASIGVWPDKDYERNSAELVASHPLVVPGSFHFLTGPLRPTSYPVSEQVAYYASVAHPGLHAIDWEYDSWTDVQGTVHRYGIQPFGAVLRGIAQASGLGLRPGLYASESLLTATVLRAAIAAGARWIWAAMYPGPLPSSILDCGVAVVHQYQGFPIDRNRGYLSLAQLRALAGMPQQSGGPMGNMFPVTAHRVANLKAGTQMVNDKGEPFGAPFPAITSLALLYATPSQLCCADGDVPVFVPRTALISTTSRDLTVGK